MRRIVSDERGFGFAICIAIAVFGSAVIFGTLAMTDDRMRPCILAWIDGTTAPDHCQHYFQ